MPINRWIRTVLALLLLALGFVAYQNKINDDKVLDKTEIISSFNGDDDEF